MQRPKIRACCPYCGNPIGGSHDDLCMAWKYRDSNTVGMMVAWIAVILIISMFIIGLSQYGANIR